MYFNSPYRAAEAGIEILTKSEQNMTKIPVHILWTLDRLRKRQITIFKLSKKSAGQFLLPLLISPPRSLDCWRIFGEIYLVSFNLKTDLTPEISTRRRKIKFSPTASVCNDHLF